MTTMQLAKNDNPKSNGAISVATKRVLPPAKHNLARGVYAEIERILPVLPRGVDKDQFAHNLIVAANELEPDSCSPASVLTCAYGACKIGLPPGKTLGLCYFVPFKGVCTLIIGYRGFLELAFGNGFLKSVYFDAVYGDENFEHWIDETGPRLKHEPSEDRDVYANKPIKAYGVVQLANGGRLIRVVGQSELANSYRDTPAWRGQYHEQCLKTVIRKMAKMWKLTPEMAAAVQWDEEAERGDRQSIDVEETNLKSSRKESNPFQAGDEPTNPLPEAPPVPQQGTAVAPAATSEPIRPQGRPQAQPPVPVAGDMPDDAEAEYERLRQQEEPRQQTAAERLLDGPIPDPTPEQQAETWVEESYAADPVRLEKWIKNHLTTKSAKARLEAALAFCKLAHTIDMTPEQTKAVALYLKTQELRAKAAVPV